MSANSLPSVSLTAYNTFWCHSQGVRQKSAKLRFPSSNLGGTSKNAHFVREIRAIERFFRFFAQTPKHACVGCIWRKSVSTEHKPNY